MNTRQWISFLALTLIWGASFLWIKLAVRESSPFTIVTLRLVFALLTLLPFLLRDRSGFPRTWTLWRQLILLGLCSTALPWLLITWAEISIDSAVATVLNATVPLFTIVVAHFWLHDDRMTRRRVLGLLCGFAGIIILMLDEIRGVFNIGATHGETRLQLLAHVAMLVSSGLYAVSNVYPRARFRARSAIFQAFYPMLAVDVLMWTTIPVAGIEFALPREPITWFAIGWLGVLGAGVAYLLFYYLLHQIGPTRSAMVTYTIPIVGVVLGVVFLGEALSTKLVVGTILIVSGVWSGGRR